MEKEPLKILSASRIKTLETCSWVYWNNYHAKIPQTQNDGSLRVRFVIRFLNFF